MRGKSSISKKIFFVATVIISLSTFVASLSPYINPSKFWIIALTGICFTFLYFTTIFLFVTWLIKDFKKSIIPLIPLLIGFPVFTSVYQIGFHSHSQLTDTTKSFSVMSYNVRSFDLYNWTHINETRQLIFDFLNKENPDILCIQEFFTSDQRIYKNLDTMITFLKAKNYHVEITSRFEKVDKWGIATFSKFPIVHRETVYEDKPTSNICIATDVVINSDTVRIYNMHLQSIRFIERDYAFVENVYNNAEEEKLEESKNILRKMKRAYPKRVKQALLVKEHIDHSPHPVIVCGDFNDIPASYVYAKMCKGLKDAFVESGNGISQTYNGPFPSFRIDYILHSDQLTAVDYQKYSENLSDHFPVSAKLFFR